MDGHCNTSIWDSWFILSILVILGLLNLGIQIARIGRGNSRETFIVPKKVKVRIVRLVTKLEMPLEVVQALFPKKNQKVHFVKDLI